MALADEPAARLLPAPAECERRPGAFRLGPGTRLRRGDASAAAEAAARFLGARLGERTGLTLETVGPDPGRRAGGGARGEVVLELAAEAAAIPPEGFALDAAPDGARIRGGGAAGLRYGAEALAQLAGPDGAVPALSIRDRPEIARRVFSLDISRGRVPTVEWLEGLAALLSRLRYNELLLYTEHTFEFTRHPEIGAGCGGLSAADLRRLDAFAAERSVALVPCLQTFGHFRRILEIPRYRALAESDRLWSVSPEEPGTYALLEALLGEYLPNFSSGWAHLNCDEPVDLGKGKSAERAAREGPAAVFAGHVNRVADIARGLGKRPMIWADVLADHPEALDRLAPDIALADWWYEADHDFDRVERFREAGRDFLTAAGTSSWSSLFPRLDTALPNIRGHARAAKRYGASGFILTDWGDGGHFNLFGGSLYPLAAGAQAAWGDEDRPEAEWAAAFSEQVAGDRSGFAGEFAARLGRLHEVGFPHFNHSPLKTVFFETRLLTARRAPAAEALRATLDRLRELEAEAAKAGLPGGAIGEDWAYSLEASRLAAERGLARLRYREARRKGGGGDPALAGELRRLAAGQRALARRFRAAWLRDNRPEGIETALALHRRAAEALARAARTLRRAGG